MSYTREEGVTEYSAARSTSVTVSVEDLDFSKEYLAYCGSTENPAEQQEIPIYAVGEEAYRAYIKKLGLSYDKVREEAILVHDWYYYDNETNKSRIIDIYNRGMEAITGELTSSVDEAAPSEKISLPIAYMTDETPMGLENTYYATGMLIVSDEWLDGHSEYVEDFGTFYFNCKDPDALQELIREDEELSDCGMNNLAEQYRSNQSIFPGNCNFSVWIHSSDFTDWYYQYIQYNHNLHGTSQ